MATNEIEQVGQVFDYEIVDSSRRPKKWCAGVPVTSLEKIDAAVREDRMLWLHNRPQHARWIANLSYSTLRRYLLRGSVKTAFTTFEYVDWLKRELAASEEQLPF